jgi:dTDP-4-amino-4,6-dideoxygalactose transaminase
MECEKIEFIDLQAQRRRIAPKIDAAIARVLASGDFIQGPEVARFENDLAAFCGAKHAIGCANGTDALGLCMMALGLRPGDAVFCPSFTFAATAEAVAWLGATPVFTDVSEETYNLCVASLRSAWETALESGLRPRAVIAVDLFGQPCDYEAIIAFCKNKDLKLICDSAQAFGSRYRGMVAGSLGDFTTTSFFPAKPLGCYGDGGAILTNHDEYAAIIRSLHVHGKGSDKYDNVRIGVNSRLDTFQAAILLEKLVIFPDEIDRRQEVAARYSKSLRDALYTPVVLEGCVSTWAQYVVRAPEARRELIISQLRQAGVPTAIYYPIPLHQQQAYRRFPSAKAGLKISEQIAKEVFALPMHPYLSENTQNYIIKSVLEACRSQ